MDHWGLRPKLNLKALRNTYDDYRSKTTIEQSFREPHRYKSVILHVFSTYYNYLEEEKPRVFIIFMRSVTRVFFVKKKIFKKWQYVGVRYNTMGTLPSIIYLLASFPGTSSNQAVRIANWRLWTIHRCSTRGRKSTWRTILARDYRWSECFAVGKVCGLSSTTVPAL